MKKNFTIAIVILLITSVGIYIYYLNSKINFNLKDSFTENGKNANIHFSFIEVSKYDSLEILDYSQKVIDSISKLEGENTFIKIIHFYSSEKFSNPNDTVLLELSKRYPNSLDLHKKLDYVSKGFIFTGSNRKLKRLNDRYSALFKSDFFVPKPEYKASEILKRGN